MHRSLVRRRPLTSLTLCTLAGAAICAWSDPASAQSTAPGFALNRFEPSERGSEWFVLDSLDLRGDYRPAFGVIVDYAYKPYVLNNPDGSENTSIITDQLYAHVGGSVVLFSRLRLGVSLPLLITQDGSLTGGVVNGQRVVGATGGGVGDLRFGADVRLFGVYGDPLTLAIGGRVWLPTGDNSQYLGDGLVRAGPQIAAAGDIDMFVYSASVGWVYRANDHGFVGHATGSEFTFGAAAGVRVADKKLVVGPEIWGSTVISEREAFFGTRTTPLAVILGGHYTAGDFRLGLGAGPGLSPAAGTAQFRGLASLEYVPAFAEPPKRTDRDADGVFDDEDACPDVVGVRTADPKTNGCPPVAVVEPAPPPPPPPPPDPDRDKDGIANEVDACPDVAGVKTDDPKTNGCPADPDRDHDGIANDVDACPDQPGPKSDDPKTSGCPRVFINNAQIQILEQPKFDFNRAVIKKESDSLLSEVAKVMSDHAEIKRVRVEGHTDNVGNAQINKVLSQQRAEAVVAWLIAHGVDKARLSAQGMGKEHPLVSNDTDAGRAANRRVEFHIESQDTTSHEEVRKPGGGNEAAPPATGTVPAGASPTPKKDIPANAPHTKP